MSKTRMMALAVLSFALLMMPWAKAEAFCTSTSSGTYCYVNGTWIKYGSLKCSYSLGAVPSTNTHPAQAECVMDISSVEVLCENPKNHQVSPGVAAVQNELVTEGAITTDDLSKIRGQTDVELHFTQSELDATFGTPQNCVNPNWWPVNLTADASKYTAVLVRAVGSSSYNYSCPTDTSPLSDCTLCSTAVVQCTLPDQYNLSVAKDGTQPNLPPDDTPYSCQVISMTEGLCNGN